VLKTAGIDERRLKMGYCTAAEGQKFQKEATQFDKEIKELGPSPFKSKGGSTKKEAKA